jgi:predicted enzyme related to lactoylglutathione lyase
MAQYPDAFGLSVTVADVAAARWFYEELYAHENVIEGVFAGIPYLSIMRDGETLVNVFQAGPGNPLAAMIPILKVDSVPAYAEKVAALGGQVIIGASTCPCTDAPFAVCTDVNGSQFMIKEARRG